MIETKDFVKLAASADFGALLKQHGAVKANTFYWRDGVAHQWFNPVNDPDGDKPIAIVFKHNDSGDYDYWLSKRCVAM